jgi:hypothetical protein
MSDHERHTPKRGAHRLRVPASVPRPAAPAARGRDPDDVAPWILAEVRAWPRSVADNVVAVRIGVWTHHVRFARAVNAHRRPA